jgi:hypothetical protein
LITSNTEEYKNTAIKLQHHESRIDIVNQIKEKKFNSRHLSLAMSIDESLTINPADKK